MKKIFGTIFVLFGIILVGIGYLTGAIVAGIGLAIFLSLPSEVAPFEFPKTVHGAPMVEILKGYRVYSTSKRCKDAPSASHNYVVLDDGSDVTFIGELRISKGSGDLYVLDSAGRQVFPGTK